MPQVPITHTPLTPSEAERYLRLAWEARFDEPIQDRQLRLLLALWDLETAAGAKQWNFNFGNLVQNDTSMPFFVADDTGNTRRFRSYLTPDDGADDFLGQLEFKPDWFGPLVQGASPEVFARGLKAGGYFEANLDRYTATLRQRYANYPHLSRPMQRLAGASGGSNDAGAGAGLFVLAAFGLGVYLVRRKRRP